MKVNTHLCKILCPSSEAETVYMSDVPYRDIDGDLLWPSLIRNPNLFYAVNQVASLIVILVWLIGKQYSAF